MKIIKTELPGVVLMEPAIFTDVRGFFFDSYHAGRFSELGIHEAFVQDSHSRSAPRTIRGLHYQLRKPQAKLLRVVRGSIQDIVVDIRRGSPTFKKWVMLELSESNRRMLYVPVGFAHGFCVPEVESDVLYKLSETYDPTDQRGLRWNDPALAIKWPVSTPVLSDKDRALPLLTDSSDLLPTTAQSQRM